MIKKYLFTNHCVDRLRERFPKLELSWNNRPQLNLELENIITNSTQEKGFLNDTEYILYLQDRYGLDAQYEFRANRDYNILFTIKQERGIGVITTCWPLNRSDNVRINNKIKNLESTTKLLILKTRRDKRELEAQEQYLQMVKEGVVDIDSSVKSQNYDVITKDEINILLKQKKIKFNNSNHYKILMGEDGKELAIRCRKCGYDSSNVNDIKKQILHALP